MRAFRILTVWLLIAAASGTGPMAASYAGHASETRCTDACKRCWCKKHSPATSFRARCPCCQRPHDAAPVTLLPPAVLPGDTPTVLPPPDGSVRAGVSAQAALFGLPVPHPPPRIRLLF